jgi:hypothetical protein
LSQGGPGDGGAFATEGTTRLDMNTKVATMNGTLYAEEMFVATPRQRLLGFEQLRRAASHSSRVPILWSVIAVGDEDSV